MPLTPRRAIYLDDLLYEMRLLLIADRDGQSGLDAAAAMQEIVNDFRAKHPQADAAVPKGVGFSRPGRPVT